MVCITCEAKLSKVIVPDAWKDGARNTTEGGGRTPGSLTAPKRFLPGGRTCRICRSKVAQDANYCQDCAHQNGICAMCGKQVDDLRFDRRGIAPNKRKIVDKSDARVGDDYGTAQRFKKDPVVDPVIQVTEEHRGHALETASSALAKGRRDRGHETASLARGDPYAGWASATDQASGRTYYYHAATQQTSWVWPPVSPKPDFISAPAFAGRRDGYIFTTRRAQVGYYRDQNTHTDFISASAFTGRRDGYVFTTRKGQLGYHRDDNKIGGNPS